MRGKISRHCTPRGVRHCCPPEATQQIAVLRSSGAYTSVDKGLSYKSSLMDIHLQHIFNRGSFIRITTMNAFINDLPDVTKLESRLFAASTCTQVSPSSMILNGTPTSTTLLQEPIILLASSNVTSENASNQHEPQPMKQLYAKPLNMLHPSGAHITSGKLTREGSSVYNQKLHWPPISNCHQASFCYLRSNHTHPPTSTPSGNPGICQPSGIKYKNTRKE